MKKIKAVFQALFPQKKSAAGVGWIFIDRAFSRDRHYRDFGRRGHPRLSSLYLKSAKRLSGKKRRYNTISFFKLSCLKYFSNMRSK